MTENAICKFSTLWSKIKYPSTAYLKAVTRVTSYEVTRNRVTGRKFQEIKIKSKANMLAKARKDLAL